MRILVVGRHKIDPGMQINRSDEIYLEYQKTQLKANESVESRTDRCNLTSLDCKIFYSGIIFQWRPPAGTWLEDRMENTDRVKTEVFRTLMNRKICFLPWKSASIDSDESMTSESYRFLPFIEAKEKTDRNPTTQ